MKQLRFPHIIARIRERRRELKISQTDIANQLHISLKAYQNLEKGNTKIDLYRLEQISIILKSDIEFFLSSTNTDIYYLKIIEEKEAYITHLEENIKYFKRIIREHNLL
ncbi:helix-turn-helix domain-containing protein [Sphingobacterium sp. LRF_L2]|uniref:helix-turn-helix domain-containing protein n=1 Tax=Sphingobacterium sp. LRF_L2 TaxID=3369421 RepID=UPI003F628E29